MQTTLPEVVYEPSHGWVAPRIRELWVYRELLYFLTWRDIKVRYKQAVLGVAWAVIQPVVTMVIFSVVFGNLAHLNSEGVNYPLFSFAALLPWNLFATALTRASSSLVSSSNLLTKVYFPRLVIPISAVGIGLVDFLISLVVMAGLMLFYQVHITWALLTLPLFTLLALVSALAVSLWLSALNVQYRDVQFMVPFLAQVWMFASPVAYSAGLIQSDKWRLIYGLNPMAGVIQGFRWALLGTQPPGGMLWVSVAVVLVLLVTGLFYFRRTEKVFADVV